MPTTINYWFPTAIYVSENIVEYDYNNILKNRCLEIEKTSKNGAENWNCNTYNTLGSFDLSSDQTFNHLIDTIQNHLKKFVNEFGSNYEYKCKDSWINVNHKNTYQEFHSHANSTFSAVYYISTPPGSGKIIFENPTEPDMIPVKNISEETELSYKKCFYSPSDGTLLIFRSYLKHMVEIGNNDEPRITAAFNF